MLLKSILIVLSFIFGVLCIQYLRRLDVHEKEPYGKMVGITFFGGLISVFLALAAYTVLEINGVVDETGNPLSMLHIGFVEEGAKLIALFMLYFVINYEMDEPTDGLIYMSCVALGFSLVENYAYAAESFDISYLIAIRLIICTPIHIAASLLMGLGFFVLKKRDAGWMPLLCAYISCSIYHSVYDIIVDWIILLPLLYLLVKGAYIWIFNLLGYTAAQSPFRKSLREFIESVEEPEKEDSPACAHCGDESPAVSYRKGRLLMRKCSQCGGYSADRHSFWDIIRHFGSLFGHVSTRLKHLPEAQRQTILQYKDKTKSVIGFQLDPLDALLNQISADHVSRTERQWWFVHLKPTMHKNS